MESTGNSVIYDISIVQVMIEGKSQGMIRFCGRKLIEKYHKDFTVLSERICLNEKVWIDGKELFKRNLCYDAAIIQMFPVENKNQEIVCYAYQDYEANRELRMLRELEMHKEALQFKDIFPEVKEVVLYGCNELAYHFVKYLEKQRINVSVLGKYWECFGYESSIAVMDCSDTDTMIISAEMFISDYGRTEYPTIRSASSEFECIDRIYEANVQAGKIKDIVGDFTGVLEKLREKKVVILGTDVKAQDTYDLLYQHGIDISYFAEQEFIHTEGRHQTLLGKKIVEIGEVIHEGEALTFIDCYDRNSALGSGNVEFFDYYGYARNEQYFMIRDYTDIPCSNLIHVLKGREVWLTGEENLCMILADYLRDVEQDDIDVQYVELSQCMSMKEQDILCTVYPWYGEKALLNNPKAWLFREEVSSMVNLPYTDYFSDVRAFVLIELYRNRECEKYSIKQMFPRGIFLGRIPNSSGNIFFRGCLDGHPNILKWGYNGLNDNLFFYCICLAKEKAQDILKLFEKMFKEEYSCRIEYSIPCWDEFKKSAEALLSLKDHFSSQELFVIFHIAYAEMMSGKKIADLSDKVIYWEPHYVPRDEYPYLTQWLEDEKINGQTMYLHRDNVVWAGSHYKSYKKDPSTLASIQDLARNDMVEEDEASYQYWTEFHMRFEDIKLHPETELMKICDKFEIPWSDTMLRTTYDGKAWQYQGVKDFDIKPVFNKYEEYLSEFDRFRIALLSSSYQKLYGYTYESCMKFSRKELQEMFLKKFRFQEKLQFGSEEDKRIYYLHAYEMIRWNLWKAHKHEVLGDITPRLEPMDIGQSISKEELMERRASRMAPPEEIGKLIEFVRRQKKLVLYGIGRDCEALLERMGSIWPGIIFCDAAAAYKETTFHGSKVIAPRQLCEQYDDYQILITSSLYCKSIYWQLKELGIAPERIVCNTFQLWENTM